MTGAEAPPAPKLKPTRRHSPGGTANDLNAAEFLFGDTGLRECLHYGSIHLLHQRLDQLLKLLQAEPTVEVQLVNAGMASRQNVGKATSAFPAIEIKTEREFRKALHAQ